MSPHWEKQPGPANTRTGFHFSLYGLNVHSDIPLPGCTEVLPSIDPELWIRRGRVDAPEPDVAQQIRYTCRETKELLVNWRGYGRFAVTDNSEIIVDMEDGADLTGAGLLVTGPLMAVALQRHGHVVLHGGAVETDGRAILFLGSSGIGKSTTVAAMLRHGYKFVTDDLCVLNPRGNRWWIERAPALVKLKNESLKALGEDPEIYPELGSSERKRHYTPSMTNADRLPLTAIALLGWGASPSLDRLSSGEAFFALRGNSFTIHINDKLGINEEHFAQCGEVARGIPVFRLTRPNDLERLEIAVQLIQEIASAQAGQH